MKTQIEATVERGELKLDVPLSLPDHTRVQVTVEATLNKDWRGRYRAGLNRFLQRIRERPIYGGLRYTREELHERD